MYKIGVVGDGVNSSKLKSLASNEQFVFQFHFQEPIVDFIYNNDIVFVSNSKNGFELSEIAIKNGKHLFIENIANFSLAEVEELIKISKEGNIKSTIFFQENKNPAIDNIKDNIKTPLFIESHRLCLFKNEIQENDVVFELMLQDLFIALLLVKSEIKRISATGVKVISNHKDIANARIEFSNGCIANFTASRIAMKEMSNMKIFQKDSYYSVDFKIQKTDLISLNNFEELKIETQQYDEKSMLQKEIEDFIFCINENQNPKISLEIGFKTLEVANKILKKINSFGEE